jgi:hypothetical protein
MMAKIDKKALIAEYKNRKTPRGMFVVRFADDGQAFVDATPDLEAAKNSLLWALRQGMHRNAELQAEWNVRGGEAAFRYDVLEKLEDDLAPMAWSDLLKDKKREWVKKLGAKAVTP